jgi:hypothetical protein
MSYSSRRGRCALVLLCLPLVGAGCGDDKVTKQPPTGNRPPTIRRVGHMGARVLTHQPVTVYATVQDLDGDPLNFLWSASDGGFPLGRRAPSVTWVSPDDPGSESLRIRAWDYEDTSTALLEIAVQTVGAPDSLRATAGASIADLFWRASPDEGIEGWLGYEIYRATRSFDTVPAESLDAYRITPEPLAATSYRVAGLLRGVIYRFRVGAVRGWDERVERSPLAPQAEAAPRPEWTRQVQELLNPIGVQGIDLSRGEVRRIDPADASSMAAFDLYFGTSDPLDGPGPPETPAGPRLKSVSLLAARNPAWAPRLVLLKRLGTSWEIPPVTDDGWSEEVDLVPGAVYAVKTPEGNYAKILVATLVGEVSPYRQLSLHWAYQTIPGYRAL